MKTVNMNKTLINVFFAAGLLILNPAHAEQTGADKPQDLLRKLIAAKWGEDRIMLPSPRKLVQYEEDLGERWVVDFETGEVTLECLWTAETSADDPHVVGDMISAVSNLYVSTPVLPQLMLERQIADGEIPATKAMRQQIEYKVQRGDTLSEIAGRFRVPMKEVMLANGITNPHRIRTGQAITIPPSPPHMHGNGESHTPAQESILDGQLVNPQTGEAVTAENVGAFGEHLVKTGGIHQELIHGDDGQPRRLTCVKFKLVPNHILVRARRYYPMVREHAVRFNHDPAVIMALIHTESAFNPQASSHANAYGLMQVVPASGGREAYRWLYSKDVKPEPSYLLNPDRNLELGNAYIRILKDRTFAGVEDPQSRLYCAVAAYNGGSINVGQTFTGRKSVQESLDAINSKSPEEVRERLERHSPYRETREYVKQVLGRVAFYKDPQWHL